MSNGGERERLVIIDAMKLRRACFASLLADWANSNDLEITATSQIRALSESDINSNCRMIVYNAGAEAIDDPITQEKLKFLHSEATETPLIIISDRDDAESAIAALGTGAQGFILTSMEPALVLEALSFIMRGGSFFPPAVVLHSSKQVDDESEDAAIDKRLNISPAIGCELHVFKSADDCLHQPANSGNGTRHLTCKQREVMELVCQGQPNKLIARALGMTEATVKVHVRQIMRKLGVSNRTQVAICALEGHSLPA